MADISWYKTILLLPVTHPWWFWSITIILILFVIFKSGIIYYLDRADLDHDFMTPDNVDTWHNVITWIPIILFFVEVLLYLIALISYIISLV